jgi:exonuclease I
VHVSPGTPRMDMMATLLTVPCRVLHSNLSPVITVNTDCKAWADVAGPSSQAVEDGIHQLRSHAEIEKDVREVLKRLKNVTRITFVHVDYLGGKVQVRCGIELDEQLRVWQAVDIARDAKTEIEVNVADVSPVLPHLPLVCGVTVIFVIGAGVTRQRFH